jgi:hypothetical protein
MSSVQQSPRQHASIAGESSLLYVQSAGEMDITGLDSSSQENDLGSNDQNLDWNSRFQSILEMPETTTAKANDKYRCLAALAIDFVNTAQTFGKMIISEHLLSDDRKTIAPVYSLGGQAGGFKYVARGILFKLARDQATDYERDIDNSSSQPQSHRYIYGGMGGSNDEYAAKASGHELKSAINYFNYFQSLASQDRAIPRHVVRVPMQALVDFRGFRLLGMLFVSFLSCFLLLVFLFLFI